MYITTRYVGVQRGGVRYLVFLLTEDYIENNAKIAREITPELERFAKDLGDAGALVRPFQGNADSALGDILAKAWNKDAANYMAANLPALLMTSVDFDDFDPQASQHAIIFLRDLIDKHGNVEMFALGNLLKGLRDGAKAGRLFEAAEEFLKDRDEKALKDALEIKPKFAGITLDMRKVLTLWENIRHRTVKL